MTGSGTDGLSSVLFEKLRTKWQNMLTGGTAFDPANPDFSGIVARITAAASSAWETMHRSGGNDRTSLWDDLADPGSSSAITECYERIAQMALACRTRGSDLYRSGRLEQDMISALDWMHAHRYNPDKTRFGNWWDWEIGAPLKLNDCLALLYDRLDGERRAEWLRSVAHFKPEVPPSSTGANRVWECTIIAVSGVLAQDGGKIAYARSELRSVFPYVTNGDNFYEDGSFIQHEYYPYTGGYAQSLIHDLTNVMELLHETPWELSEPERIRACHWLRDSFEPLMYCGAMLDMVMGRVISRRHSQNHDIGHIIIRSAIRLSRLAPPAEADTIKRTVKEWIRSDTYLNFYCDADLHTAVAAKAIMDDERVVPRGDMRMHKQFANMARTVHARPGFVFGVSMHSSRIANYETINGENLRGWHTSDGMTYLYNGDLGQYSDAYWPTVDCCRLPGTTVLRQTEVEGNKLGDEPWAGGAELLGLYGAAGMSLHPAGQTLRAFKSWFMFDEEIAALGSGISAGDGKTVETIVENRKLDSLGANLLTVDGSAKPAAAGWFAAMTGVQWAHLQGHEPGADIGYYFPGGAAVQVLRETRSGAWSSINRFDTDPAELTRHYLTLWFDHGVDPEDASYAYVLLPNKTAAEVKQYTAKPGIVILENSAEAHAVRQNERNATGINVWIDGGKKVGDLWVDRKSSVMLMENEDQLELAVADPTFRQTSAIQMEIDKEAESVLFRDPAVTIVRLRPTIRLTVDVRGAGGKTFRAAFKTGKLKDGKENKFTEQQ